MANTATVTTLVDGPRSAVFHVYMESDGASGELVDFVIADPTALYPTEKARPSFTIEEVWHSFTGFDAKLEFDSVVDTPIWVLSQQTGNIQCFNKFGGLKDRSNSLDGSGKLLLSTTGFTSAGDMGSLVIQVRKN